MRVYVASMSRLGLRGGGNESYPERPDEPDCVYYLRTGVCGYGSRCQFNHPPNRPPVINSLSVCFDKVMAFCLLDVFRFLIQNFRSWEVSEQKLESSQREWNNPCVRYIFHISFYTIEIM